MKDNFILYNSYEDKFKMLDAEGQAKLIMALFAYNRGEDVEDTLSPTAKMAYAFITNQMNMDKTKYIARCETNKTNGRLGGRPKTKNVEKTTKITQNKGKNTKPNGFFKNRKKPNGYFENPNDNDNDNDNDYNIVSRRKNIFNNYNACAGARACERTEEERSPFKVFYKDLFDYCYTSKFLSPANELADTMIEALEQAKTPQMLYFAKKQYSAQQLVEIYCKIDSELLRRIVSQLALRDEEVSNRGAYILSCIIKSAEEHTIVHDPRDIIEFKRALGVEL